MTGTRRWNTRATIGLVLVLIGVVAAILLALSIPSNGPLYPGATTSAGPLSGAALGERIFQTGRDENGRLIPRSGVMSMMGSSVACADCHGSDARGRTIQMMMGPVEVPDIRWSTLTATPTDPDDKAFDPDSFFLAVTQGIDPSGSTLAFFMPRWQLTRAESDAIVEYLKTR